MDITLVVLPSRPVQFALRPVVSGRVASPTAVELAGVIFETAGRTFGSGVDASLLERVALEAATDVLGAPTPIVYDYLPELALRTMRESLGQRAA